MTSETIAVAIFAGGQSQRMGEDKALLKIGNETLLERAAKMALEVSNRVYVVGRVAPENWKLSEVEFLPDDTPNLGPIGGLRTILKREKTVLALACDLPKMTSEGLYWLIEKPIWQMGLLVQNAGQWEPLFSIYTAQCLPLIEENIEAGRRSLHALIKRGDFDFVKAPPEIQRQLLNVNTPEEWRAIQS